MSERHQDDAKASVAVPELAALLTQKEWRLSASKVGGKPVTGEIVATATERASLAKALELLSVDELIASYKAKATGRDRYALQGRLTANVTQACVVSGRPVEATIDEDFAVDLWPAEDIAAVGGEAETLDPFSADPPEPLDGDNIDIGSIVYQCFAVALDPYPRHPDSSDATAAIAEVSTNPPSPFAVLEGLKQRK